MEQCVYETKICDIDDQLTRLIQTWFDFEQNVTDAAIDQSRDSLWRRVHADGGHFEHMMWSYCSFALYG